MSEQAPEEPPAETGVEQRVDSLESKVDKILGILGSKPKDEELDAEQQAGGGTNIAHEIRAQLEERDAKARADAAEQGKADRLAAAEAKIAELTEKPPEPMPRRVERIMGWR